jgi:hypothetical protein
LKLSSTLYVALMMQQLSFPLLCTIVNDLEIESVLPCSEEQRRALDVGGDLDGQTILFKLQTCDGKDFCIDRLGDAWQKVVQQRAGLRTVFAIGSGATDIFQVVVRNHDALFTHAHFGETDDFEAKVEQEPLPVLATGAPMHMAQAYTADGAPLLLRLCYSSIAIDDDCLVGIQTDLPRVYQALAVSEPPPNAPLVAQEEREKHLPSHLLERMKNAEPTILGLGMVEAQKTTAEYTNVTMPGSLGEALLLQCSNDGVAPTNMLQALWLILLAKYLRLEQPCCMYRLTPSNTLSGTQGSGFLCTKLIVDDDQVMDLVNGLYEQTLQDGEIDAPTLATSMHDGKRLCNSIVCWRDRTIASNKPDQAMSMKPIKARGFEEVSSRHISARCDTIPLTRLASTM